MARRLRIRQRDIDERFRVGDRQVTSMGILAIGEFAAAWFEPGGRLTVAEVAEQYAELAVRMVRVPAVQR